MRKGSVAFGGMIVGLVLLIIAFIGLWYTMNGSGTLGVNYHVGFYLDHVEAKGSVAGQMIAWSSGYAEAQENAQNVGVNTQSFTIIETARSLSLFAIATGVLALIGMAAFVSGFGTPRIMKYFGGGFAMVTFVLALVPAVYIMTTGFSENSTQFWFSQTMLGVTITGGPGYAWYLMIVVAIIALICGIAFLLKKVIPKAEVPPK
jgi:hypothetical protein